MEMEKVLNQLEKVFWGGLEAIADTITNIKTITLMALATIAVGMLTAGVIGGILQKIYIYHPYPRLQEVFVRTLDWSPLMFIGGLISFELLLCSLIAISYNKEN